MNQVPVFPQLYVVYSVFIVRVDDRTVEYRRYFNSLAALITIIPHAAGA